MKLTNLMLPINVEVKYMADVMTPPPPVEISVIVSLYNAEKYIGACLQSILTQTFKNFEVIVVDDCSTDNSVKVVESFIPKFGGRLKLSRMEKNSGSPAAPENRGVALAVGKYIYVMDNDDLIVNVTLETLHKHAENFGVDVVYMDNYFNFISDVEKPFPNSDNLKLGTRFDAVKESMLITDSLPERLKKACSAVYFWPGWHKFVKRKFLIDHDITFPDLRCSSDLGWTVQVICHADRILRIPEVLYVWRALPNSVSRSKRPANEAINYWADMFVNGIKYFDEWMCKQKFFTENPQYKFMIFDLIARDYLQNMRKTITTIPVAEYQNLLESKLKSKLGEDSTATAYLLATSTLLRLNNEILTRRLILAERNLQALQAAQDKNKS